MPKAGEVNLSTQWTPIDHFFRRVRTTSSSHGSDLDTTMLGKPAQLAIRATQGVPQPAVHKAILVRRNPPVGSGEASSRAKAPPIHAVPGNSRLPLATQGQSGSSPAGPKNLRPLQAATDQARSNRAQDQRKQQRERNEHPFSPLCYAALLMESEQRGLFEHEIALLESMEGAAGHRGTELGFGKAVRRVAALRLDRVSKLTKQLGNDWRGNNLDTESVAEDMLMEKLQNFHISALPQAISLGHHVPYSKELHLLSHVLATAEAGNPGSVCAAIENFGEEVLGSTGLWLKIAGGSKSDVLTKYMRQAPDKGSILEIGTYCGYSSAFIASKCPGVRIISLEADPAHMIVARNVLAFAGLTGMVDVWTGHSKDLLYRMDRVPSYKGESENLTFRAVFMDQKGSRYVDDLEMLEKQNLLVPGAVVVADNVLKPGSPLYLWRVVRSGAYDTEVVTLKEFAMPAEDWMSVSIRKPGTEDMEMPEPPRELVSLERETDRIRDKATRSDRSVTYEEWAAFSNEVESRLKPFGIEATQNAADFREPD
eukprot:gnl/TRDRNA2_/TRDRNA2_157431_c2_seq1.p1 gnl/TRDRNA2_/TRDRNA2_157431_c2~~gnl/TRDRNA2_/TRDRNA2_157431_c2_seq1.p1  ORF type:complete len:587 (-),score=52.49 gnl/TRDRNA2_/TRDRNA2_157431_c2_seq1:102-1718(-)